VQMRLGNPQQFGQTSFGNFTVARANANCFQ
jgi:hypothetical protein